jgi:hypothetical protein
MDAAMAALIKERRKAIRDAAPCEGCGASLASCKANRGKDPTAPPWFGCCARGMGMAPCAHREDPDDLRRLLDEFESGNVRSLDEMLLDSVKEDAWERRALARMLATWTDPETDRYGE